MLDFEALVEPLRPELHAHCYRMLGSVYDADDALQEALLRAWRGVEGLRNQRDARAWLYKIATNVCLTELQRRKRRVLPHDFGPDSAGDVPPGQPVAESVWIEPYPADAIGLGSGFAAPDARYEQREGIELAFVAALQHLAPNQRSVLILREVLGFSAAETASMLGTTVASVTSALQRARVAVAERVPERSQQATLAALGQDGLAQLVERWVSAWERSDVDAMTKMLVADASFAMPPLATWYRGREQIGTWARSTSMSGAWDWRGVFTHANAQPALGFYSWDADAGAYLPFALNVLTLAGEQVADVTAFIVRAAEAPEPEAYVNFPREPFDRRALHGAFTRFGLAESLPA
ncbi:MAG: RNA polymerase subunit sigma-70 [Solirubrobacterales bacterium]|nr:RNA polymerase subunit sigma-70 [Solirubrobacterales bacterium]